MKTIKINNLLRGGIRGQGTNGRYKADRAITNIKRNVDINRALWTLTEKMAELKA